MKNIEVFGKTEKEASENYHKIIKQFYNLINIINLKILDQNPKKLIIKGIYFLTDYYGRGFYNPRNKTINLLINQGDNFKSLINTFLHELTHAYQHQIIPYYYIDIIRNITNSPLHDFVFKSIFSRFKKIINDIEIQNEMSY